MLNAINSKNRNYYENLNEDEKKKFAGFVTMRWASAAQTSNSDVAEYWLRATNQMVNIGLFDLHRHHKLQWLLITAASPGMNTRHEWIKFNGRVRTNPFVKILEKIYPSAKLDDLEVQAELMTKDDIKKLLQDHGWQDAEIKRELK